MKVVILGATGFLGSHILLMLKKLKYDFLPVSRQKKEGFYFSPNYMNLPDGDLLIHLGEANDRNLVNNNKNDLYNSNKRLLEHISSKNIKR